MSTDGQQPYPPPAADLFDAPPTIRPHAYASAASVAYTGAAGANWRTPPPMAPTLGRKEPGKARRILSYVAVVWGALSILLTLKELSVPHPGAYRGGQFLGLILAAALVSYGVREIASHHVRRFRALPWIMGLEVAGTIIAVVAIFALHVPYPSNVQANFTTSCEARGGTASWCGCALTWFESHKTLSEFITLDSQARATGQLPPDVLDGVTSSCPR